MKEQTAVENLIEFFSMSWVGVFQALLTPTIALVALYIAYQQLRTNRSNSREKLFDRRMVVFEQVSSSISLVARESFQAANEAERELTKAWQQSRFLFGADVQSFIERARRNIIDGGMYTRLSNAPDQDSSEMIQKERECFKRTTEHLGEIWTVFEPYLSFDDRKW